MSNVKMQYGANTTEYQQAQNYRNNVLTQYSLVILADVVLAITKTIVFVLFFRKALIKIHTKLVNKIINSTMPYFDKNLSGNIVNRFSRDLSIVDESLPFTALSCLEVTLTITSVFIIISSTYWWYLIPSVCFGLLLWFLRWLYLPSGRNIRRLEGSVRSPVIGHMQITFDGLTTIRACEAQEVLKNEFNEHFDEYNSVFYIHLATVEAIRFCLDTLTTCYIAFILIVLPFLKDSIGTGAAGLAITQSFTLTFHLQWCAFQWSELEMFMTSAERVYEYSKAKVENTFGNLYTGWPRSGKIVYKNVSLRYSEDSEQVLKHISFSMEHGEKIGIVGRTGAGKSSIVSALFRLYPFDGTITIDSIDINTIKVDELRSKISIIPQNPTLFSGTIRSNLDPSAQFSDKELWNALEQVEMKNKIDNLYLPISEHNNTFSVGEKHLICLARVILQSNSIVVLDEATACVDSYTENLIQQIIRRVFTNHTVIIIAHRLSTVMECAKILVIDDGVVVEYDNPKNLICKEGSIFHEMVKEAGLLHQEVREKSD